MIELIFVIVILGILAAVALPRFATIQDDANIAAEKSAIGSVRSGLQAVRGRWLANPAKEANITFLDQAGGYHRVSFGFSNRGDTEGRSFEKNVSINVFPNALSLSAIGTGTASQTNPTNETTNISRKSGDVSPTLGALSFALILEPDGRENFTTFANASEANIDTPTSTLYLESGDKKGGLTSVLIGPATGGVIDPSVDACKGRGWVYNSVSGNIALDGKCVEP
jgi:type II secretory pathway pseudopilin PulG